MSNLHNSVVRSRAQSVTAADTERAEKIQKSIDVLEQERHNYLAEEPYIDFAEEKATLAENYVTAYKTLIASNGKHGSPQLQQLFQRMKQIRDDEDWHDDDVTDSLDEIRDEKHKKVRELLSIPGMAVRELHQALKRFHTFSTKHGGDSKLLSSLIRANYLKATSGNGDNAQQQAWLIFTLLSNHPHDGYVLAESLKRVADAEAACAEQGLPIPEEAVKLLNSHPTVESSGQSRPNTAPPTPSNAPPLEVTSLLHPNPHPHAALQVPGHDSGRRAKHQRRPSNLQQMRRVDSITIEGSAAEQSLGQLSLRQRAIYKRGAGRLAY